MAFEQVQGWDQRVYLGVESTFGTALDPLASNGFEVINLDMGAVEQGVVRAKKDKTLGRGMTSAFVEGRIPPLAFALETSVKSRAANTTPAKEAALLKSAGLVETVGGSSVTYGLASNNTPPGLSVYTVLGTTAPQFAQQGRGGVVKGLQFSGGDAELVMKASGAFIGNTHMGSLDSLTVADGTTTAVTAPTPDDTYRLSPGYYQWESEIIKITAVNNSTGGLTILRAQLGSTGAAHASKPIYPYSPTPTLAGSPISEQNVTVTIDGATYRCTKFNLDYTTGVDHLRGESGSKYIQGLKAVRVDAKLSVNLVLTKESVGFLGKATQRKTVAATIQCGTAAGGIWTASLPTVEFVNPKVPAPPNDIVIASIDFRARDNSGNDLLSLVYS